MAKKKIKDEIKKVPNKPIVESNDFNVTKEIFRCWTDIEYYAKKYCKVWDKKNARHVPFKLLPTQRKVIEGFENHRKNLVLKYRQGGISTITQLFLSHLILSSSDKKIAIVAHQKSLAINFLKETTDFISNLPEWLQIKPTKKDTNDYKIYFNNIQIRAFSADANAIRGFSPDILVIDEAAYLENASEFWTSAVGSLSAGGEIILISTPAGLDSLYWATYDSAIKGENDFNVVEIKWWEDSRFNSDLRFKRGKDGEDVIDDVWLDELDKNGDKVLNFEKCIELTRLGYEPTSKWYEAICASYNGDPKRIASELNNKFLGSAGNWLAEEYIVAQETKYVIPPIRYENHDNGFWIWVDPDPNKTYVLGVDVSDGNTGDYSSIEIFDAETFEQVAEYQGKISQEDLGDLVFKYGSRYNNGFVVMDVTGGRGSVSILILMERGYKNIYYTDNKNKSIKDKLSSFVDENDKGTPGYVIGSAPQRRVILTEMESLLRNEVVKVKSSRLINEIKTFVWNEAKQRFDHMRSTHDDLLFGYVIGISGLNKSNGNDSEKMLAIASNWTVGVNTVYERSGNDVNGDKNKEKNDLNTWMSTDFNVSNNNTYKSMFLGNNNYDNMVKKYQYYFLKGMK